MTTFNGKLAAFAAIAFGVLLFLTVASIDPPIDAGNAETLDWFGDDANHAAGIASGLFALGAAGLFALLLSVLGTLPGADRAGAALQFTRTTGAAFVAALAVTGSVRWLMGDTVGNDDFESAQVLSLLVDTCAALMAFAVMATIGLTLVGFAVTVLRSGALAGWFGVAGLVLGVIVLAVVPTGFGPFAIPFVHLWCILLAVAIWRRPAAAL